MKMAVNWQTNGLLDTSNIKLGECFSVILCFQLIGSNGTWFLSLKIYYICKMVATARGILDRASGNVRIEESS